MKKLTFFFCIALIWGCTSPRYVYTPSAVNNPFLTEKGDGEINAMYSTSASDASSGSENSSINGLDLMGSYALADNFGIQAHYFFRGEKDIYSLSWPDNELEGTIEHRRNEFELGIGGFVPLEKSKTVVLAGWAGVGFGGTGMDEFSALQGGGSGGKTGSVDYKTTRLFFQPSINFIVSEHFKAGLVAKFNSIRFSDVHSTFTEDGLRERYLNNLDGSKISVFEAGYNISFGFRGFRNVLFTHQLTFAGSSGYYDIRPLNFSIGVSYVFKPLSSHKPVRQD
jgi:hypothetical protein